MKHVKLVLCIAIALVCAAVMIIGCSSDGAGNPQGNQDPQTGLEDLQYKLYGINIGPYTKEGQSPDQGTQIPEDQANQLIDNLVPYTQRMRFFTSVPLTGGSHPNIIKLATSKGHTVIAGCWLAGVRVNNYKQANQAEIDTLIQTVKDDTNITHVTVGSECMERYYSNNGDGGLPDTELIAYINQVRQAIKNSGSTHMPIVTTGDTFHRFIEHPDVVPACDGEIFVNIYPYWSGSHINNAIHDLDASYSEVTKTFPQTHVTIGETGWPSKGATNGQAVPSEQNAAKYFKDFVTWARGKNVDFFYFEAYDEPWKGEGGVGGNWGIFYSDMTLKPGMDAGFDN